MLLNLFFPSLCLHCKEKTPHFFCERCQSFFEWLPRPKGRIASCFTEVESVTSFVEALDESQKILELAVDCLIIHFSKMRWPNPDIVTSVPKRHFASSNVSEKLAVSFAKKMGFAYKKLAKRPFGDLPRETNPYFFLPKRIETTHILVIDDKIRSTDTLKCLMRVLQVQLKAKVYGLTLTQL